MAWGPSEIVALGEFHGVNMEHRAEEHKKGDVLLATQYDGSARTHFRVAFGHAKVREFSLLETHFLPGSSLQNR